MAEYRFSKATVFAILAVAVMAWGPCAPRAFDHHGQQSDSVVGVCCPPWQHLSYEPADVRWVCVDNVKGG
jgi:hypothetical protein